MTAIAEEKAKLRKLFARKRDAIAEKDRNTYNQLIFTHLTSSVLYSKANSIFIFVSFRSEVNTLKVIEEALFLGKQIYVPRTIDARGNMEAVKIETLEQLKPGRMGLLEPEPHLPPEASPAFDLIILPGLAFDKQGYRLGYGGGFYDKFLSKLPEHGWSIGLGYSIQITDHLPTAAHDQRLDGFITEAGVTLITS